MVNHSCLQEMTDHQNHSKSLRSYKDDKYWCNPNSAVKIHAEVGCACPCSGSGCIWRVSDE